MVVDGLRETLHRLTTSAGALAALGAALDARVSGDALDAAIQPHVDEVVEALGLRSALHEATEAELLPLLGEVRALTLSHGKLLFAAGRGPGWTHTEEALLQAAGDVSAAFPRALKTAIAPRLAGLAERLQAPDAAFLDVGTGVGVLAIQMARTWPSLRVVGVDPWAPALALARDRVRGAGLDARIELREQAAEALGDVDAFDLAWIPSLFVPERAIRAAVASVHRALRPGGWLLFAATRPGAEPLSASVARLRTAMFGGWMSTPEAASKLLVEHGLVDVAVLPGSPTAAMAMVVARRLR